MIAESSADGASRGSAPIFLSASFVDGSSTALTSAPYSFVTIGFGNARGPRSPAQPSDANPGRPLSLIVGRSGHKTERVSPAIASARARPACTCTIHAGAGPSVTCDSPEMTPVTIGPAPL